MYLLFAAPNMLQKSTHERWYKALLVVPASNCKEQKILAQKVAESIQGLSVLKIKCNERFGKPSEICKNSKMIYPI